MRSLFQEAYSGEVSFFGELIRSYSGLFGELFGPIQGVIRSESWSSGAYSGTVPQTSSQESTRASIACQAGRQVALEGATLL